MLSTPVLIVGAGPTGLVLALNLARRGVPFRIIDDDSGPGTHSRAMAVHARTLELYRQFGFADEIVARGVPVAALRLREAHGSDAPHELTRINLAELGTEVTPYPFVLAYAQDDHERFLITKLEAAGAGVEWNSKLAHIDQDDNGVRATIVHNGDHTEMVSTAYVCGCDGPHSAVRESLGIGFPGGTYEQRFYVADVKTAEPLDSDLRMTLGEHLLALMLPVRTTGMQRLIGLVPPRLSSTEHFEFDAIRRDVETLLGISVVDVNWFSTYRVHHRVAERFAIGRTFLAGDAGHVHSPVGAQGMNTGIGDAMNLGWKLAHVIQGRASTTLLATYEQERIGFARTLVSTTDRAFTPMIAEGTLGEIARRIVAPIVFTVATKLSLARDAFFRTLSQLQIDYGGSPLSSGRAGDVHGGDRLPWVASGNVDNFDALRSLDWQAHVYGRAEEAVVRACADVGVSLETFAWSDAAREAGLRQDALYLVRPDGYVALAAVDSVGDALAAYAKRWAISFHSLAPSTVI